MLIAIVDDRLELTVTPPYDAARITALLEGASADPRLPARFGLLIDTRSVKVNMNLADVAMRVLKLRRIFGNRMAAVVSVPADDEKTPPRHLKTIAEELAIPAAVFHNIDAARLWLAATRSERG
jgi:hypothetical protein